MIFIEDSTDILKNFSAKILVMGTSMYMDSSFYVGELRVEEHSTFLLVFFFSTFLLCLSAMEVITSIDSDFLICWTKFIKSNKH